VVAVVSVTVTVGGGAVVAGSLAVVSGSDSAVVAGSVGVGAVGAVRVGTVTLGRVAVAAGLVAVTPVRVVSALPSPPPQDPSRKPARTAVARPDPISPSRRNRPSPPGMATPAHHPDRVIRRAGVPTERARAR